MARRYGWKCSCIVVEADGVVEACRLCRHLAEATHAFRTVMEPPGRAEFQRRIDAGERREFARIARLVKGKENDGQAGLEADCVEQRLQCRDVVGLCWNVKTLVA